jgi:hypothetical protein
MDGIILWNLELIFMDYDDNMTESESITFATEPWPTTQGEPPEPSHNLII